MKPMNWFLFGEKLIISNCLKKLKLMFRKDQKILNLMEMQNFFPKINPFLIG
jgi:hypothetical protein